MHLCVPFAHDGHGWQAGKLERIEYFFLEIFTNTSILPFVIWTRSNLLYVIWISFFRMIQLLGYIKFLNALLVVATYEQANMQILD